MVESIFVVGIAQSWEDKQITSARSLLMAPTTDNGQSPYLLKTPRETAMEKSCCHEA